MWKSIIFLPLLVGCVSPTEGFFPECWRLYHHPEELNSRGQPTVICRSKSTAASRANDAEWQMRNQIDELQRTLDKIERNTDD